MNCPPFESEADWEDFVRRFEAGAPTKEEWTHGAHMCVGAWFVSRFSPEAAGWRIRSGMRRLNECLGGRNTEASGFHETLTEFWIRAIRAHLDEHGADLDSLGTLVLLPTGLWSTSDSINLPKDVVARREYVEPTPAGL